ncbi:cytochrome P450 [Aspergillus terreus]|uniref:Cytochrome P450 n=1 Tax=Aspergillus terreus TaxID=33178 RepID=A0A5M3Z3E8_ASPTE|nr:hypothetical protein ATETN484_0006039000 [Aspergillus terreus]GFF12020.1 cytochrome P450 [Aspergillus terreus]
MKAFGDLPQVEVQNFTPPALHLRGGGRFQEWSRRYGPIISLKTGPANLVILNKATDVRELFDKRGVIYSSRPTNHIGNGLITRDNVHLLLMLYGQAWRNQRKIYQAILSITAVRSLTPLQEAEATLTLYQLSQNPRTVLRPYSADQFTAILETGVTPPVDVFPFLKLLPDFMSPWSRWARQIRVEQRQLYFELLQEVKSQRARGIQRNCFMSQLLEEKFAETYELDEEHIAYIGGVLMEGGSDTTASMLLSFLLAMTKYPKVFQKAQEEVDRVLRWRPVAAGGLPHVLIQNDEYKGFNFPTGTTFLANTWAIHHDPELYDRPDDFIPERYEHHPLGFKTDIKETTDGIRMTYGFGAGRRICPGSHLAENSLDINIAKIIWAFDIRAGTDPTTGRDLQDEEVNVDVATQWTDGFLIAPKPFPIVMKLRSQKHREVLYRELEDARRVFQSYED